MSWDKERIAQLQLPDLADDDPHPRLLLAVSYTHLDVYKRQRQPGRGRHTRRAGFYRLVS